MNENLANNQFVQGFVREFDAFLRHNYEVRRNARLMRYKPKHSKIEIDSGEYDFNERDLLFLGAIILRRSFDQFIRDAHWLDLVTINGSTTYERNLLTEQWVRLLGSDDISHARFVYRVLHNKRISRNMLIPLLKQIGIDLNVLQDIESPEIEFVEKYKNILWLPVIVTNSNAEAIHKLLFLLNCDAIRLEFNRQNGLCFIGDFDEYTIVHFTVVYLTFKLEYPSDFESFVKICNNEINKLDIIPPLWVVYQLILIDQNLYLNYEIIFHILHNCDEPENRNILTNAIIKFGKECTKSIIDYYEDFCAKNNVTPIPKIVASKALQAQDDDLKTKFEQKYKESPIDRDEDSHLGLDLTWEKVFNLYQLLKEGYIESKTSIEQFCYALTGKLRSARTTNPIIWEAGIDEFAILINTLYRKRQKPQNKICTIFNGTDPNFNTKKITSRCSRVDVNKHLTFANRIKNALNS